MFTVVETWHEDNGNWGNRHHEAETLREALELAASFEDTATVEVWAADGSVVLPLCSPSDVVSQVD